MPATASCCAATGTSSGRSGEQRSASCTSGGSASASAPNSRVSSLGAQPEVIVPQQPLVRRRARRRRRSAPYSPGQLHVARQRRGEHLEVVRGPRRLPLLLALGGRARELGGELLGNPPGALPVAPREPHDVALDALQLGSRRAPPAIRPSCSSRGEFVVQAGERGELLRAGAGPLGGHHHQLVPARAASARIRGRRARAVALAELLQARHGRRGVCGTPAPPGLSPRGDRRELARR